MVHRDGKAEYQSMKITFYIHVSDDRSIRVVNVSVCTCC